MGKLSKIAVLKPIAGIIFWLACALLVTPCKAKPDGELLLELVDSQSGDPVATRIHLRNSRGRTVRARGWGLAEHADHAYVDGSTTLGLKRGAYRFDLDAGPEYRTLAGHFEIDRDANDTKKIELKRFANLATEGWRSADLGVLRDPFDHEILLRAEQLDLLANLGWQRTAPIRGMTANSQIGSWETAGRIAKGRQPPAGSSALWSDWRGAVWLHDPTGELTAESLPNPNTNQVNFLIQAKENGWIVVASATSWELPIWIAHDLVDALLVIDGWSDSKAGALATRNSRQATERRFQDKQQGPAKWREAIYHKLIEAGITTPPVAASGSGLNDLPIGTSRVYFFSEEVPQRAKAWEALLAGESVITNGPLLRPFVEGSPPGVELSGGYPRDVQIGLNMATRTSVDYLEIIQNGRIAKSVRLMDWASAGGKLPPLVFNQPGWFVVRAVTNNQQTYQFASTAPYFVGNQGDRISASAAQFFIDWLTEYAQKYEKNDLASYQHSLVFWQKQLASATAE